MPSPLENRQSGNMGKIDLKSSAEILKKLPENHYKQYASKFSLLVLLYKDLENLDGKKLPTIILAEAAQMVDIASLLVEAC